MGSGYGEGVGEHPELALAGMLAEVSQLLVGAADVDTAISEVCRLAVENIPGCESASVSLVSRGALRSVGVTSEEAAEFDDLQYREGEGPCLEAIKNHEVVRTDDLRYDRRWPALAGAAERPGSVRSVLAYCLRAGDRPIGALNLYSSQADAFDRGSRVAAVGALFSRHAAVALAGAQTLEGLRVALDSRETISVAMGILMAREGLTRAKAFDVLRRASQRENIKLRDIAARIAGGSEGVLG